MHLAADLQDKSRECYLAHAPEPRLVCTCTTSRALPRDSPVRFSSRISVVTVDFHVCQSLPVLQFAFSEVRCVSVSLSRDRVY